jgi:MFS family permease
MLIILYIIGFTATLSDSSLFPVIPLYATALGSPVSQVGFIVALYSYVTALLIIPSGRVSDNVGPRKFLVMGLAVFAAAPLLYTQATQPGHLVWVRIFHGLGYAFFLPTGFSLAVGLAPVERRGEAMGWYTMALHLGHTIGPITGGFVLKNFGFATNFYGSSAVATLGLLLAITRIPALQGKRRESVAEVSFWSWLQLRAVQASLLIQFVTGFGMGNITAYLPLLCRSMGLTSVSAGLVITALFGSSAMSRAPAGRVSDKIGRKPVIIAGLIIIALGLASISQSRSLSYLVLSGVLFGLGMGVSSPATFALVAESSSVTMMGLAMGILSFSFHFGLAVGPTSMGVAARAANLQTLFLVCASIVGVGFLAVVGLLRHRQ